MQRRDFLTGLVAASIATPTVLARGPIQRSGPPRLSIALAAYSLRSYFGYSRGKPQRVVEGGTEIDMFDFLDYCVAEGFDGAELTSYFFPPQCDDAYLLSLRHAAFTKGLAISGTAIGNNFTVGKGPRLDDEIAQAKQWIDRAAVLGAPHVRFFAGTARDLNQGTSRLDEAIAALSECAAHAATKGVFLGVENHGNLTAANMLEIMRRVDSPWIGINLDTGNFHSDDPYADLTACAPYAVNVQAKVSMKTPAGKTYPADFTRIGKILKDSGYQGFVNLEYEDAAPYENIPKAHQELRSALA
ncbi:sugar phosphate isomerase/epimerase family protein [Allorhodopirellula solitaria]|uniref:Xylose isomerase-like TIM barrel n=1 Tax=Allorhodopirellula solitaria TaxID=2527987 RepID=A0A5C5XR94_9BACT|nr:sugar phosphate isomerase/epimerase family protein [Allorhodopirellula solitaria]TWT65178.1 Xylose isomerase-like TIM barrel [Allorhodopirellula solitaria]